MKTKKTGKTMRVAGLLLALVLVTSCFVGGTFAKYVTTGGGTDHARVAKFGVTVKATGNDTMFATQYDKAEGTPAALKAQYSVVSGDTTKVVAPGTKNDDCLTVSVTGKPEVAVEVDYDAVVNLTGKWEYKYTDDQGTAHTEFYCPLVIKVGDKTFTGTDYTSVKEFTDAVAKAITDLSAVYPAGTELNGSASKGFNVSWEWPFEGGKGSKQTDVKDTYLGNQAATLTGIDVPNVVIQAAVTVTQID